MELSIAIGKAGRKTARWENTKTSWAALVKRLSNTVRTPETFSEYLSYPKEKQAEIKDRGGFVGGYLKDGKRSPGTVAFRQILTLDIDYANKDFWTDFTVFFPCAAIVHSTHKHSPKSPRLRLAVPLNRTVNYEEYEAIGRKVAAILDIDVFDPTTFQPERLMYWPTTSSNGEYYFREQTGAPLNADKILNLYVDWTDISEWPKAATEKDYILHSLKKQGTPGEKPGLIGAFCRAYTIDRAIEEFLPDVYEPTGFDDRYSFVEGSGASGAIVYGDSEFLFSHHSTDPICGMLVNAFDLVRLHKFGHEDDGSDKEISKRKSHHLMTEFASEINEVVAQVGTKKLGFDDLYDSKWLGNLTVDKYGVYESTIDNFNLILSNDENLKGRFRFDNFNHRETIVCPVPWDTEDGPREFTDKDEAALRHYFEKIYGIYHSTKCKDALDMVLTKNTFHPIKDYLETLVWDGETRVDSLFIDYLGAEDTEFIRQATRKMLTAAVARIYEPGIKFDYTVTLTGEQGIGKSRILRKIGGKWYSDSFVGVEGNKSFEQLHGVWIMEVAELAGFKKAEAEAVKHFISKQTDRFRVAYGKRISEFPRQTVFVGSTNTQRFLTDSTGNRRYWPIEVNAYGALEIDDMPVDQIWAEAVRHYRAGEKLYFNAIVEEAAREAQAAHLEVDDRTGLIVQYLSTPLPLNWSKMSIYERRSYLSDTDEIEKSGDLQRLTVCVAEIWAELFGEKPVQMGPHNTKYIHQILNTLPDWEKGKNNLTFPMYGKHRAYVRTKMSITAYNKRKANRR